MNNWRIRLEFNGSCLKQEDETAYTPKNVVILFIVCELDSWPPDLDNYLLEVVACLEVLN